MTTHVTRRFNSVAGKSFNPLGGGAGVEEAILCALRQAAR